MEETLYDKMLEKTEGYISPEMSQKQAEYLAKDCANIGIHAQIDLLNDLQKDTENTNAKFRIKLIVKINELENQLFEK